MSELIKPPQTSALAIGAANEWLEYGKSLAARAFVGELLRFIKGDFVLGSGDQQRVLVPGTKAIAVVPGSQVGWQNFTGGTPGDHIFIPATQRFRLPTRTDLGDTDSSLWEIGEDGRPKDPWQSMRTVPMVIDGKPFTFVTSSAGGKGFIGNLATDYGYSLSRGTIGKLPEVELTVGSYQHKNRNYGRIKFPDYKLLGWVDEEKPLALFGVVASDDVISDNPALPAPEAPPGDAEIIDRNEDDVGF